MKMVMIAALVAAQLSAAARPAQAAELPREELATQQHGTFAGARLRLPLGGEEAGKVRAGLSLTSMERTDLAGGASRTRFGEGVELNLGDGQALALRVGGAPVSPRVAAAQEDEPKKGKSTGDKVLTGAAVILGIGAVAVGGLLIALFAN